MVIHVWDCPSCIVLIVLAIDKLVFDSIVFDSGCGAFAAIIIIALSTVHKTFGHINPLITSRTIYSFPVLLARFGWQLSQQDHFMVCITLHLILRIIEVDLQSLLILVSLCLFSEQLDELSLCCHLLSSLHQFLISHREVFGADVLVLLHKQVGHEDGRPRLLRLSLLWSLWDAISQEEVGR